MSCAHKALLVVVVVTSLGLWGCTQNRGGGSAASKVRDLEARNAKLEEDYKAAVADGADVRKKLADSDEQVARLTQQVEQLPTVQKERDRLSQQVKSTQSERNALQTRLQDFSRELQALAGRVDAAAGSSPATPPTSTTSAKNTAAPGSL